MHYRTKMPPNHCIVTFHYSQNHYKSLHVKEHWEMLTFMLDKLASEQFETFPLSFLFFFFFPFQNTFEVLEIILGKFKKSVTNCTMKTMHFWLCNKKAIKLWQSCLESPEIGLKSGEEKKGTIQSTEIWRTCLTSVYQRSYRSMILLKEEKAVQQ